MRPRNSGTIPLWRGMPNFVGNELWKYAIGVILLNYFSWGMLESLVLYVAAQSLLFFINKGYTSSHSLWWWCRHALGIR